MFLAEKNQNIFPFADLLSTAEKTQNNNLSFTPSSPIIAMDSPENFSQTATQFLIRSAQDGTTQALLRAHPESMGPITAEINFDHQSGTQPRLEMTLSVSNSYALDLAQKGLQDLQTNLAAAGLPFAFVEIRLQEQPLSLPQSSSVNSQDAPFTRHHSSGQHPEQPAPQPHSLNQPRALLSPTQEEDRTWHSANLFDRSA
jgi:hypothetical protein